VNTLSRGRSRPDVRRFATLWTKMTTKLGLQPEFIKGDWRSGVDAKAIEARLVEDKRQQIKAVAVAHNDLHGLQNYRGAPRDQQGRAPSASPGRHDLVSRLERLPSRRVERACDHRWIADGIDAATGTLLQRHLRQGSRGVERTLRRRAPGRNRRALQYEPCMDLDRSQIGCSDDTATSRRFSDRIGWVPAVVGRRRSNASLTESENAAWTRT
jgi:hypothetical protein